MFWWKYTPTGGVWGYKVQLPWRQGEKSNCHDVTYLTPSAIFRLRLPVSPIKLSLYAGETSRASKFQNINRRTQNQNNNRHDVIMLNLPPPIYPSPSIPAQSNEILPKQTSTWVVFQIQCGCYSNVMHLIAIMAVLFFKYPIYGCYSKQWIMWYSNGS